MLCHYIVKIYHKSFKIMFQGTPLKPREICAIIGRAFSVMPAVITSIERKDKTLYKSKIRSVPAIY